jgi:hypothetical protein
MRNRPEPDQADATGRRGRRVTRGRLLGLGAAAGVAGAAAALHRETEGGGTAVALGRQPSGLPSAQHAWNASLRRDARGDLIAPRHDLLLMFELAGAPSVAGAHRLEAALRTLERRFAWSPSGLLFALGWGPTYFTSRLGRPSPVPDPEPLSTVERPTLDRYDACLHLACDSEPRLTEVADALGGAAPAGSGLAGIDLTEVLTVRERRSGFAGAGLPAAHRRARGIPGGDAVSRDAPLFMGFKSGLKKNQASEAAVTIARGPFAGGTTMQVSYMRLALDGWYERLNLRERVARMYAPQVTPAEAAAFSVDAASDPQGFGDAARRYGVVGHAQASAQARVFGKPRILRRDFDTVDGGVAGVHFVSVQQSIDDFVATRRAMDAATASFINPAITPTVNNGINDFIFVQRRANYIVPSRAGRTFPLYDWRGRSA